MEADMVTRPRREHWRFACAVIAILLAGTPAAALDFPERTSSVVDDGGHLGGATNRLAGKIADFEARTGLEMAVAMIESLQGTSLEEFSAQLARHWKMGAHSVLLVAGPIDDTKATLVVGDGLKGHLTEALVARIRDGQINPRLADAGKIPAITRGVDDLIRVLTAPGGSHLTLIDRLTPDLAQDLLKESGYEIIEAGKLFSDLFMIRCNVDKHLTAMFLSECASAGCERVGLLTFRPKDPRLDLAWVNAWNDSGNRGTAYLDSDGDVFLALKHELGGGVTRDHLRYEIDSFRELVKDFAQFKHSQ